MIPVEILENLRDAVARWDASNTDDERHETGKALAAAAFSVLIWDQSQGSIAS